MIAPRILAQGYENWNRRWGSPFGRARRRIVKLLLIPSLRIRYLGPFAFQANNDIRRFEYPWAYEKVCQRGKGLNIVEIGGSRAGLQFVLAREGHHVTNVDPGLKAQGRGWNVDHTSHDRLCRAFGASVSLINATLGEAKLASQSADVVLAISVLEHFTAGDLIEVSQHIPRILRPEGVLIATIDLFLELSPFTRKAKNEWGSNLNIRQFLFQSHLALSEGNPSELCGFEGFQPSAVLENLPAYMVGSGYPCLSQCLVARLRAASP